MTEESCTSETKEFTTPNRLAIFCVKPILEGEDPAAYEELFEHVSAAVSPLDIFEEIWVREIVDLIWEIFRLCNLKRNLLAAAEFDGISSEVVPLLFDEARETMGREALKELLQSEKGEWTERNPHFQKLNEAWHSVLPRIDPGRARARAFVKQLDNVERIDRLTTIIQGRRNSILREIAYHRVNFGQVLSKKLREIEEVKFEPIKDKAIASTNPRNEKAT